MNARLKDHAGRPVAIERQVCPPGQGLPHLKKATEGSATTSAGGNFPGLAVLAISIERNEQLWYATVVAPAASNAVVVFQGFTFATVDAGTVWTVDGSSLPWYAFAGEQILIVNALRAVVFWGPPADRK